MKNTNSDRTAIMLRLLTIAFIMVIMNSCAIIDKLSNDNSDFFDEVGFFQMTISQMITSYGIHTFLNPL